MARVSKQLKKQRRVKRVRKDVNMDKGGSAIRGRKWLHEYAQKVKSGEDLD